MSRKTLDRIQLWVYLSVCCAVMLLCARAEYKGAKVPQWDELYQGEKAEQAVVSVEDVVSQ